MTQRPVVHLSAAITVSVALITAHAATPSGPKPVFDASQGDGNVSAFYRWEKEVPGTPGRILRQESLPAKLMLANASRGVRVLYTSTDGIDGKTPVAVSGAVYFPKGSPPQRGWAVMAWGHGNVGVADVCAPSWAARSERDTKYLNAWLAEGFAIAATDYQGLGTPGGHPTGLARPEAYSVIDSARSAVRAFPELSKSLVLIGQSQGSRAVITASLLAHDYAPDFDFKATVATGVSSGAQNLPQTKAPQIAVPRQTGGGANARYSLLSVFRLKALDSTFEPEAWLSDQAKPVLQAARTGCSAEIEEAIARNNVTVENLFQKRPDAALAKAGSHQRYPAPKFSKPVFIGTGLADATSFPEGQYNFVMAACYEGSTVEAHYYPGMDHNEAVNASLVHSIPFVKKIMAGQQISNDCKIIKPPPK